jgi:hypothetical protein
MTPNRPSLTAAYFSIDTSARFNAFEDELRVLARHVPDIEILILPGSDTAGASDPRTLRMGDTEIRVRHIAAPADRTIGALLKAAIDTASMDYFTYLPDDGSVLPHALTKLLAGLDEVDIALAVDINATGREHDITRRIRRRWLEAAGIRFDLDGPFLFPTKTAKVIAPGIDADTEAFCFELIRQGMARGMTAAAVPVTIHHRKSRRVAPPRWRHTLKFAKELTASGIKRWFFFQG